MISRHKVEEIWNTVEFDPGKYDSQRCAYAEPFFEWCCELIELAKKAENAVQVNRALLYLQAQYVALRNHAQPGHRDYLGGDHVCLYQVWLAAYSKLYEIQLLHHPPDLEIETVTEKVQPVVAFADIESDLFDDVILGDKYG